MIAFPEAATAGPRPDPVAPEPEPLATVGPPRFSVPVALGCALVVTVVAGLITHATLVRRGVMAGDLTWAWRGAVVLLHGSDPYRVITASGPYPFDGPLLYPLPAVIAMIPFTTLRPEAAGALFVGLSGGLLTFVLARRNAHWLPMLVSAPFLKLLLAPQWSALIVCAALVPGLQWLCATKPNVGLAAFLYRPNRRGLIAASVFVLASVAVLPAWPLEWLRIVATNHGHPPPLTFPLGLVLLLAVLRWRTREGRLLLVMAALPQELLIYDQLLLWLVPRRWWSSLLLAVVSWPALAVWAHPSSFGVSRGGLRAATQLAVLLCIYLPALLMVLTRRNEGPVPAWVERALSGVAARLRRTVAWRPR